MLYRVLTNMTHKVFTNFVVSDNFLESTNTIPLFGSGQGSGASPIIWLTTCEVNMKVLRKLGYDVIFCSPRGDIKLHRHCDAFVDDTSLTVVSDIKAPGAASRELLEKITHNGQIFEKSLWASGGALNLQKCAWYLLVGKWEGTKFTWRQNKSDSQKLLLTSEDSVDKQEIEKKNPTEEIRQLGVFNAPLGKM